MNTYYKTKRKVCRLKWHRANGIVILQTDINSYPNRYRYLKTGFTNDHFLSHNVLCKQILGEIFLNYHS